MAARTALTPQTLASAGLNPTYAAPDAANGNTFVNNGKRWLLVRNGAGTTMTVTVRNPSTVDGIVVPDKVHTVPANGDRIIGPLPTTVWNQPDSSVYVDYSTSTSITQALLEHP